jgi:ATP-binding cassette subfamily F protein uup
MEFPGALVLVTHDRYLLERVSQRLLALDGHGHAGIFPDVEQWRSWQAEQDMAAERAAEKAAKAASSGQGKEEAQAPQAPEAPIKASSSSSGAELSTKEKQELKGMEAAIAKAEAKLAKARAALEDPAIATDAAELIKRQGPVDGAQAEVDALFKRWEELEAKKQAV